MPSEIISSLGFKYPASRDNFSKSGEMWLQDRRNDDGAEGLWRIYNNLYDFSDFVNQHPGGKMWLELSKGTDITEAFEVHHISKTPELLLSNYFIKKATSPRQSPYTFEDDGFYKTLKRNVSEIVHTLPKNIPLKSNFIADVTMVVTFLLCIAATYFWSYALAVCAGLALCCITIIGHNYFHQKENFRRFYFDLSLMESREWRITHVLSHHVLTNTIHDLEISFFEPILYYLPNHKSFLQKVVSVTAAPLVAMTLFHVSMAKRVLPPLLSGQFASIRLTNLIPFSVPALMYLLANESLPDVVVMWTFIVCIASTKFGVVGLSAAHHHPDIFHEGDAIRENKDWGLCQMDSVMDKKEVQGKHFFVLAYFGDHALHHMFPSLDQGLLHHLYPVFNKTCKDFGIALRTTSQFELIKGNVLQLLRSKPNENVPDLFKYSKT